MLLIIALIFKTMSLLQAQNMNDQNLHVEVRQIVSALTLSEKASLCSGRDDWSTKPIDRLHVPWIWLSDGPHGVRRSPATNKSG